jgi:hypothetical protein
MRQKFHGYSTAEQANKIYRALNPNANDTDIISQPYNMSDIFNLLPNSITYNGRRGDLCITPVDIAYFSVGGGWEHILVHFEPIDYNEDIYDAFYKMIKWLKENKLM